MFSVGFAPKSWALCNGQLLPINQNQALFSLLGTTYGGNGTTNFALPNLQARVPIHQGAGHILGERAGTASHTLLLSEMPTHIHVARVSPGDTDTPIPASTAPIGAIPNGYRQPSDLTALDGSMITTVGGSQAHNNSQPYSVVSFCIALTGVFPSQN